MLSAFKMPLAHALPSSPARARRGVAPGKGAEELHDFCILKPSKKLS